MSEIQAAGVASTRESRTSIAINAVRELILTAENTNNRLIQLKGAILGVYEDGPDTPTNKEVEPNRCKMDELDYMQSCLSREMDETGRHLAYLEGL